MITSTPTSAARPRGREAAFWRRLVLERLHLLFALLLVLQLLQCFKEYWWPETFHVIYAVLAVYGVTELLIARMFAGRVAIQLAAVVAASILFTPFHWYGWPMSWNHWADVSAFLDWHIRQLHPFVELAAGVLLATHAIAVWGTTRTRTIAVILASVGTLAAVDSYFPYRLWPNIAVTVLVGLGWLVVLHLRSLRARHFDSWAALAERPFELVLPALVVTCLLVLVGVVMPRAPVLLEDPYTLWMASQHKSVPSLAGDGGFLIDGSPLSAGVSRSAKSGYGRNDAQIGGGFQFDYSPVMEVTTTQKSYWRGETKAVYTGKGWADRKGVPTVAADPGEQTLPLLPDNLPEEGVRQVVQTVKMIRNDRIPVLFAAGPVSDLQELDGSGNPKLFWNPEEWELRFQRPTQVKTYTVVSEVRELDEARLRSLSSVTAAGKSSLELTPYLQLPDSLPKRVGDLAKQVTAGAADEYDQLKMLEQYLQTTYPYTTTPDTSKQKSDDVVDAFLFEIKEGYCDYYSTAFVVMARTLGIPTRWVKGYTSGSNPEQENESRYGLPPDPNGAGTYTVRNSDAHSWAEAYFEGYGWVPFEPTSGFAIPLPQPEQAPTPIDVPDDLQPSESVDAPQPAGHGWIRPAAYSAGAAALLLALTALIYFQRRRLAAAWEKLRYRGTTPSERIVREMESLVKFMHRKGYRRNPHDTLRESMEGWGGRNRSLQPELDGMLRQFESARYGGERVDEEASRRFAQSAERIRKAL